MRQHSTGDIDPAAQALAERLGGLPSRTVPGFDNREFDVVSDEYIAQTTSSQSAVTRPSNFLTMARKAQIRATLQAAKQEDKIAYFEFTVGRPHPEVVACISRNALRLGAVVSSFLKRMNHEHRDRRIQRLSCAPRIELEAVLQIKEAAKELLGDIEVIVTPTYLDFDYSGRDAGRKVVKFLCRAAVLIGSAEGEVECRLTTDMDGMHYEFYVIHASRLYRQEAKLIRMPSVEVISEASEAGRALASVG